MSRRDPQALNDYLEHVREAIGRIQRYLADVDHAGFLESEEKQDAVIRNLEVIGEAAGNIDQHFPPSSSSIRNSRFGRPMTCEMPWRTDTSRWTSTWSGRRWSGICLDSRDR